MTWLRAWWERRQFDRALRAFHGFRTNRRTGEGFEQWLDRETRAWVKGN